jgi:BirA family biotin operon repressor/biotin-[acetyl-CoA-carboxylase] ligase
MGGVPIFRILEYGTVSSTQDKARELALSGEPEGTVVLAREQTRGRGRGGRKWHSPPDSGIWATCILRPRVAPDRLPILPMAVSVAIARAIERLTGREVAIKWPNDIYMQGKKLGGVLCETDTGPAPHTSFVLAGFGINLREPEEGFDAEIAGSATSLEAATGAGFTKEQVLAAILRAVQEIYCRFQKDGGTQVVAEARRRDMLRGDFVRLRAGTGTVEGRAAGIGEGGGILVEVEGKEPAEYVSGEILSWSRMAADQGNSVTRRGAK